MYEEGEVIWKQQQIWIAVCCCHFVSTEWQIILAKRAFIRTSLQILFSIKETFFCCQIISGIVVARFSILSSCKNNLICSFYQHFATAMCRWKNQEFCNQNILKNAFHEQSTMLSWVPVSPCCWSYENFSIHVSS